MAAATSLSETSKRQLLDVADNRRRTRELPPVYVARKLFQIAIDNAVRCERSAGTHQVVARRSECATGLGDDRGLLLMRQTRVLDVITTNDERQRGDVAIAGVHVDPARMVCGYNHFAPPQQMQLVERERRRQPVNDALACATGFEGKHETRLIGRSPRCERA